MIPVHARPNEVAILRIYLLETYDPKRIAELLHYKTPRPVYKVLRKYRKEIGEVRQSIQTGTTTAYCVHRDTQTPQRMSGWLIVNTAH